MVRFRFVVGPIGGEL